MYVRIAVVDVCAHCRGWMCVRGAVVDVNGGDYLDLIKLCVRVAVADGMVWYGMVWLSSYRTTGSSARSAARYAPFFTYYFTYSWNLFAHLISSIVAILLFY